MIRKALPVLAVALFARTVMAADTYSIDRSHSQAGFKVKHMLTFLHGRFDDFGGTIEIDEAKPESSSVSFEVKATSIDTDEPKRDADLRSANWFDVAKFPELTFKSTKIVKKDKSHFEVTGPFTLHGVTKEITLAVEYLGSAKSPFGDERASFEATININRKDYGLTWNKTLDNGGLLVGDEVGITVDIEAVKKAAK